MDLCAVLCKVTGFVVRGLQLCHLRVGHAVTLRCTQFGSTFPEAGQTSRDAWTVERVDSSRVQGLRAQACRACCDPK